VQASTAAGEILRGWGRRGARLLQPPELYRTKCSTGPFGTDHRRIGCNALPATRTLYLAKRRLGNTWAGLDNQVKIRGFPASNWERSFAGARVASQMCAESVRGWSGNHYYPSTRSCSVPGQARRPAEVRCRRTSPSCFANVFARVMCRRPLLFGSACPLNRPR